jgi:opacity protein-like surface antigen
MRGLSLFFLAAFGLFNNAAHAQADNWDGLFLGIGYVQSNTNLSAKYSHQHSPGCTNLNFGSEWPGDNCEGNQDYAESIDSRSRSNLPSIFVERLWVNDRLVYGLKLGIDKASKHSVQAHRVLSTTWGDTLNYKVNLKDTVRLSAILGQPVNEWLPYVGAGIVFQRASISIRQDHSGYNLPIDQINSRWFTGGELILGVKRKISEEWVASAEFSRQKIDSINGFTTASLKSGGLRYPDTQISANADTKIVRISLSRRF